MLCKELRSKNDGQPSSQICERVERAVSTATTGNWVHQAELLPEKTRRAEASLKRAQRIGGGPSVNRASIRPSLEAVCRAVMVAATSLSPNGSGRGRTVRALDGL